MSDLAFEQMLAEHNANYKEAEDFSGWMPEDGGYIVTIIKVRKGVSDKDGTKMGWWSVIGRIEDVADEKINGREFTLKFLTTKAPGILKGFAKSLNDGEPVPSLPEADAIIEASKGTVVEVKVSTTTSKKNGRDYTNCFIQKIIDFVEDPDGAGGEEASAGVGQGSPDLPDGQSVAE